jgi:hypothetical protein
MVPMLKTFLIWLCMLSLPIHGMAAVTMAACGAGHRQVEHMGHHATSMHDGHHGARHEHQASHAQSSDKCSACAVCCTAQAMVAPMLQWQGGLPEPSPLVGAVSKLQPSFLPEGFDRPPRSLLA